MSELNVDALSQELNDLYGRKSNSSSKEELTAKWEAEKRERSAYIEANKLKIKEGKNFFRPIPNPSNPKFPFIPVKLHDGRQIDQMIDFLVLGEDDPIKQLGREVQDAGNAQNDKSLWGRGKRIEDGTTQLYMYALVDNEVKLVAISKTNAEKLINIIDRKGDITNPETGYTLCIVGKKATGEGGKSYVQAFDIYDDKVTPVDLSAIKEYPNPKKFHIQKTEQEMKKIADKYRVSHLSATVVTEAPKEHVKQIDTSNTPVQSRIAQAMSAPIEPTDDLPF